METETRGVLQNILAILDSFSNVQPSLGVREAARITQLAPSTAGRLMQDLRDCGLLEQDEETRTYRLGARLLGWAGILLTITDLRQAALPYMLELKTKTSETVSLYQLEGNERLCIERIESDQNIRMVTRIGQRLPLYAGSAGKAMLAFLPEHLQQEIIREIPLKPFTNSTITDAFVLQQELKLIRQNGFAVSHGEWISDASGIAVPLFGLRNEVIGGLSISGPTSRFSAEHIARFSNLAIETGRLISAKRGAIYPLQRAMEG